MFRRIRRELNSLLGWNADMLHLQSDETHEKLELEPEHRELLKVC
jgi:hypothetical protein